MKRKLFFLALLSSSLGGITANCPPGSLGLNRDGQLVCVQLSEVINKKLNRNLNELSIVCVGPALLVSCKEKMYWERPEIIGVT